jgi:beta-lactamase regulating signal transducer with metallopeptidase domain
MSSYTIDWMELSIQWLMTCGHFLWQGFVVAMVFLVIERIAAIAGSTRLQASQVSTSSPAAQDGNKHQSIAAVRYMLACAALLSLPLCVMLTFVIVHNTRGAILKKSSPPINNVVSRNDSQSGAGPAFEREQPIAGVGNIPPVPQASANANEAVVTNEIPANNAGSEAVPFSQQAHVFAPLLSAAYAIVVGFLLLRTSFSLLGSLRFRNASQQLTDPQLLELIGTQAKRLKLKMVPIVAICARVSSPVVVGVVRPMILLPPSLLCGLDPTQLAAILSHEMAHIRRYDLIFNLVQRLVESLLFFHPIVWWLSRRMTIERENCCDDVAALHVGRLTYAEALVGMASVCLAKQRSRSQALATLAADGGDSTDFGYRIRRLIDAQETPQIRITKRSMAFSLVAIGCLWASLATFAQTPQTKSDEPAVSIGKKDPMDDGIQWSTWGDRDGLLSGARLILPDGGIHPGQPVIVEYRLKNVSTETKTLACYVRKNWDYVTLDSNNFLRDMGINSSDEIIEINIEAGKEYVLTSHTAKIDTTGLLPGEYHVALGTAFYYPDATDPGTKHEIPHRGSITFKVLGEANLAVAQSLDESIHWGEAISGLRLGAKFQNATNSFDVGEVVETDLWIANVSDETIECSIRLPHPMDGWWLNVENESGDTILLEREPLISIPFPQEFYKLKLAPGEVNVLTGDRIEGQPFPFAAGRAKFKIVSKNYDRGLADYTVKEHLVTEGGDYSAKYHVILERPDIPGLRIELDTSDVSFTVLKPIAEPSAVDPADNREKGNRQGASAEATDEFSFDDLKFDIEKDGEFKRSMLTKKVESLSNSTMRIRGYILPQSVFKLRGFEEFVLVRDNQECCFGPGAALYDCIVVRLEKGKTTDFVTRPIVVEGRFEIKEFKYPDSDKHYAVYQLTATEVKQVASTVLKTPGNGPAVEPPNKLLDGNRQAAEILGKKSNTGSLQGRITFDGSVPKLAKLRVPTPTTPRLSKRAGEEAVKMYEASLVEIEDESLQVDAENGLANAFVYLPEAPSDWQPSTAELKPLTIEMQDYRFEPRAAILRLGLEIRLKNAGVAEDNFNFQPLNNGGQNRLVKEKTEFTLASPFTRKERTPIQAKSDMNSWKMTYLLPLDHPFAAVTDKQGRFSVEGLPSGTHKFQIWHERTGWLEKSLTINIEAGQATEVNRSFGIDRFRLTANQSVSNSPPSDILWGDAVGGVRLGIRQAEHSRKRTILRHGEHLDYEVWIKNETDQVLEFDRDPRDHMSPNLGDGRSINVIGGGLWASFFIPPEELEKSKLILRPGEAARRFLPQSHSASIRPPGSPRGRFGSDPLLLEPGKYEAFAQFGDLRSGVEEIEIIPAARLQIRKSSRPTEKSREYAAQNPSDAILEWQNGNGEKEEALINLDHGVFIDERDLAGVELVSVEGQPDKYSISLQLRPESAQWLSRTIASYSLWDDPDMVAILFDAKPLGAAHIPASIADDKLLIPTRLTREQAESMLKEIQAAMASPQARLNATAPADAVVPQLQGVKLVGEVKLPNDEWLFRRQVNQVPSSISRERPQGFKGDSLDPEDGRVVHKLTWKDVIAINVIVKANDGRDYLKAVQADEEGKFRFDEVLPIGSYQVDVNAVLTMDDNAQVLTGEPPADLRSGTQLLHVKQEDTGANTLVFELFPVPFNSRVFHADPAQRTAIMGTITQDNEPVPNAKVILYGGIATRWKVAESVTDERGQYRFENVIGDYFGVQVKHEKLVPADGKSWRDIDVEYGKIQPLDVPLTSGGFVTGQLLDENKQPRANLNLRIMRISPGFRKGSTDFLAYAQTDATGNFTSEPLSPGTYAIEENAQPYVVFAEVEVRASETTKF